MLGPLSRVLAIDSHGSQAHGTSTSERNHTSRVQLLVDLKIAEAANHDEIKGSACERYSKRLATIPLRCDLVLPWIPERKNVSQESQEVSVAAPSGQDAPGNGTAGTSQRNTNP